MSSATGERERPRWGLRARLTLWTAAVLTTALAAGFASAHYGLRAVLESKNDAFLASKAEELAAVARDARAGGEQALEAEVRREVAAYAAEGLVVVVRRPGHVEVAPATEAGRRLAERLAPLPLGAAPRTVIVPGAGGKHRALRVALAPPGQAGYPLDLALSLAQTEAILGQFDRRVAVGGLAFLAAAVAGGFLFARQALRPVAASIRTARRLNPADLSARLPRTGSGDELDQLATTINGLLDRLAAYHAQVIRFTADASHELRSPVAAMRAAVEVALQQPRTEAEYRDILGSLGEQCDRLTVLVDGLLLLARADAGEVALRYEPVDLSALVDEVAEMYLPLAEERGLELSWGRTTPAPLRGDPQRLRQLVTNLVDNALKFTGPGGRVGLRVGVDREGDRAVLAVEDTGVGIAPEHLPHIFERFYQADPARSSQGAGLGLSICRWIAQAHGGSIVAASAPGRGTTFTVTLPVQAGTPDEPDPVATGHSPEPGRPTAAAGPAGAARP
jgi:heavy metal sensor kinase